MSTVLVTGASGFAGRVIADRLEAAGHTVRRASRRPLREAGSIRIDAIGPATDWSAALAGADAVVHLAGIVHDRRSSDEDHTRVDVQGSARLAEQAMAAGARRIVYMSSLAVYGVASSSAPITSATAPAPATPYGRAKLSVEELLTTGEYGLLPTIVRAPLVHGPHAPGNFGQLTRAVLRGVPLPVAGVANRRSLIGRDNLADFIVRVLEHPDPRGTFLVADARALSTEEIVRLLAEGAGKRAHTFRPPRAALALLRRSRRGRGIVDKLLGSLEVDTGEARRRLGWSPPVSIEDGIRAAARAEAA